MRSHEIENWVLRVIECVKSGQPNEDSRVELKAQWIDPSKAARRIAGHANAARGELILWVFGVDEKQGVVGADHADLAAWYPSVKKCFDEEWSPSLIADLNVSVGNQTVVALLFETDRAPFVIKNLDGKGSIDREVPWREGTSIHSATRAQLIRLLSPLQKLPSLEVLSGSLSVSSVPVMRNHAHLPTGWNWLLKLELYISTKSESRVVIPMHRCKASFKVENSFDQSLNEIPFYCVDLEPLISERYDRSSGVALRSTSLTIRSTSSEVLLDGPGRLDLVGYADTRSMAEITSEPVDVSELQALAKTSEPFPNSPPLPVLQPEPRVRLAEVFARQDIKITASLLPVDAESPIVISETLHCSPEVHGDKLAEWKLGSTS